MKKVVLMSLVVALSLPIVAMAADVGSTAGKNPCLLNSENCGHQAYSIQELIAQLEIAVGKGASVYSSEELETLQAKLDNYKQSLVNMTAN